VRGHRAIVRRAFVVGLFLVGSYLAPDDSLLGGDQLDLGNRYVAALIQNQEAAPPPPAPTTDAVSDGSEGSGQAARGPSGEMGARDQPHADRRSATAGDAPPEDWQISNQTSEDAAQNNVITNAVALIAAQFAGGPNSPFASDHAIGGDSQSVLGNLLGAQIGSSGGMGGLVLRHLRHDGA